MTLGTDLLNLRRNRTSTVLTLISSTERLATARTDTTIMMRAFSLKELGDAVLANVAVHALEAYWGDTPLRATRRATSTNRRKNRRIDTSHLYQRRLFA
ncbi:MAG TPA: hypothetical protein VMH20_12650 [Verrucomicrobiae bacterium]|nr:hypothetical protein [Verrucomicrobiae bacterium]